MLDTVMVGEVRLLLRLPPDLRAALAILAKRETRSLNGQIIHMLRQGLPEDLRDNVERDET
jgi:hypothetical protein